MIFPTAGERKYWVCSSQLGAPEAHQGAGLQAGNPLQKYFPGPHFNLMNQTFLKAFFFFFKPTRYPSALPGLGTATSHSTSSKSRVMCKFNLVSAPNLLTSLGKSPYLRLCFCIDRMSRLDQLTCKIPSSNLILSFLRATLVMLNVYPSIPAGTIPSWLWVFA